MTDLHPAVRADERRRAAQLSRIDRLPEMLAELLGPRLPVRPACTGRSPLFDLDVVGETDQERNRRHAEAIAICSTCGALDACRRAVVGTPTAHLQGVWAATVLGRSGSPTR
ncbi:hypothetical protein WEH80_38010 [Actinomycetes bacterium KLBMP 9759]